MRRGTLFVMVLLAVLAGCSGGGSDGPIEASASPATIDDGTLSSTGYELASQRERTQNTSFTITITGDVESTSTFEVTATTHRAVYERSDDATVVGLATVPTVKPSEAIAEPINPFRGRQEPAVAANATGYEFAEMTHQENQSVTMLGNETTLQRYSATVAVEGEQRTATVGIAPTRDDGDAVTAVFVVPEGESAPTQSLLDGVQH